MGLRTDDEGPWTTAVDAEAVRSDRALAYRGRGRLFNPATTAVVQD